MAYIHRVIEDQLRKYLRLFPVIGLMGPRQSGKSTLLRNQLGDKYRYVTFDYQPVVDAFYNDPIRFMEEHNDKVIFDEVQKVPEIFNYIKIAVDNDRNNYGKYILTGSSQFSFIKNITESLAGRMGLLTLLPFQYLEIPPSLHDMSIYSGGYPELVMRDYQFKEEWFGAYLTTYLEKDVRNLMNVGDLHDFSRFINLLAANTSQLLNLSNYARDIGTSVPTIKRWLSVLEASYIIFLLPPYYKNYGKRIVKSPKVYFVDTGFAAYLTKISNRDLYEHGPMKGALFENYIISEIYKRELLDPSNKELCYLRTSNKEEIDLIIDRFTYKEVFEIKASHTFKPAMINQLNLVMEKNDKAYLLYNGESLNLDPKIKIWNYHEYLAN